MVWKLQLLLLLPAVYFYTIPSPIDPEPIHLFDQGIPVLEGQLEPNEVLQKGIKFFENEVFGPESYAADQDGWLYTGTADGRIWKFKDDIIMELTRTGIHNAKCFIKKEGESYETEEECGRPKGMKVHTDGFLYVADCYMGLLRVNTSNGIIQTLVTGINGQRFKFLNGLDISKDNKIYFTASTTKWDRKDYRYEVIETNKFGRLLAYDIKSNHTEVIRDGLYFANGLALGDDETWAMVAELSVCRVSKVFLKGPRRGESEVIANNLPGYPDNIKPNSRGTFYIGLGSSRFVGASVIGSFLDIVAEYPALKRLIVKVLPFWVYNIFLPKHAIFLEMDESGKIRRSFHDPGGKIIPIGISDAFEHNGYVYIGRYDLPFVGRLSIKDMYQNDT